MIRRLLWKTLNYIDSYGSYQLITRDNKVHETCVFGKKVNIADSEFFKHSRAAEYASVRNCKVGAYSSLGRYSKIVNTEIGKYCAISWDTTINAVSHPINNLTISAFPYVPRMGSFVKTSLQTHQKVFYLRSNVLAILTNTECHFH